VLSEVSTGPTQSGVDNIKHGIVPLGHNRGEYFYISRSRGQIVSLSASRHDKLHLVGLADLVYYWERTPFRNDKGGIDWLAAANHLMRAAEAVGIFDPDRIRGRGAWVDNGRSILHLGNQLLVNGDKTGLALEGSSFVYENAVPLSDVTAEPLPTNQAVKLLTICQRCDWDKPIAGRLLAGWIVAAIICGATRWRSSIWITGGAGSGKTFTMDEIIKRALGRIALYVQSKTTEAGVRQKLGSDALPVVFDEFEREDAQAKQRVQGVLDLLRQASSDTGAEIIKGTQSQNGIKRYRIRSAFCLSSINVGLEHYADETRVTVLTLVKRDPVQDKRAYEERRAKTRRIAAETLTPQFSAGLVARAVRLMPTILQNAEIFTDAVALHLGSRRIGDQLGTLLAGAHALELTLRGC
jgi:putative DNA primase/helicase